MISNCGHDERGKYTGGQAGDQTGQEWAVIPWYNRPWNVVLRHNDWEVREKIAELAKKAAENNHIGYDQGERYTFWEKTAKQIAAQEWQLSLRQLAISLMLRV